MSDKTTDDGNFVKTFDELTQRWAAMHDGQFINASICQTLAAAAPSISPYVVIITRGELERLLFNAFNAGMAAAERNINRDG